MGDVVMISEESMEMVMEEEEEEEDVEMMRLIMEKKKEESVIKWEDFLPKMYIRVLLVESDDCTRKIISALLRKCGYRVTAVSDGTKAWEILEGRPKEIDLVLTEVELPSVSGLCLLTMMMEHEICKNLPVIMMSSNDSIGMVFKCMLRGAVDFLVKPIRKNELRILWQHVWRRHSQSSCSGHGVQVGMSEPNKIGAISENNAASNNSSDCVASTRSNKESSDKESDAQSSCTKREVEAESACNQITQELSQPKSRSPCVASNTEVQNHKDCVELDERLSTHDNEEEHQASTRNFDQQKDIIQETHREDDNIPCETMGNNSERVKRPREAIDLMGSFDDHRRAYKTVVREVFCNDSKIRSGAADVTNKFSSGPLLELSLPQFHQSDCGNQQSDEICMLSHSNVSAFSPYTNRIPQPFLPILVSLHSEPKEFADNCHQHLANQDLVMTHQLISQPSQAAAIFPCPQPGALLRPVPVNGTPFDSLYSAGYGSVLPRMFYTQPCPPSLWNPSSDHQQESAFFVNSSPCSKPEALNDQNFNNSTSQAMHKQLRQSSDYVEKPVHVTADTDQSRTSSLCNGSMGHHYSTGYGSVCNGSNGDITPAAVTRVTAEYINEEGLLVHDGNRGSDPHRSTQRELALTKFRLKRKDRCFEKKVRYQSRKKLAEQRPRVKGQFVRQIATDAALTYTNY